MAVVEQVFEVKKPLSEGVGRVIVVMVMDFDFP